MDDHENDILVELIYLIIDLLWNFTIVPLPENILSQLKFHCTDNNSDTRR